MINNFQEIKAWVNIRTRIQSVLLLILGCMVISLIWVVIISRPIIQQKEALIKEIQLVKNQINTVDQQEKTVQATIEKINLLQKQLKSSESIIVSAESLSKLIKGILVNKGNIGVKIINIKKLPTEPVDKFYKHSMQIEFQSDYLNTISYLNMLEKQSLLLYWDTLDYKVIDYPEATVIAKFYVMSSDKS